MTIRHTSYSTVQQIRTRIHAQWLLDSVRFAGLLTAFLVLYVGGRPARASDEDRQRAFLRALDTFERAKTPADFQQAALLWESLLGDGYENGAVCYNLGNARMRAGNVGLAIAAYRRARRLLPREPSVEANLNAALDAAPDAPRLEAPPWWQRVLFWHATLAQHERLQASAWAWTLAFLLGLARLFTPVGARMRKTLAWCAGTVLAAGVLLSTSALLGYQSEVLSKRGVVAVSETLARKGNGPGYDPAFDRPLKEGAEFVALETRGGWIRVRLDGAGEGWIPEKDTAVY